jgi:hypothetical protein
MLRVFRGRRRDQQRPAHRCWPADPQEKHEVQAVPGLSV